jgi:hypothetical protein
MTYFGIKNLLFLPTDGNHHFLEINSPTSKTWCNSTKESLNDFSSFFFSISSSYWVLHHFIMYIFTHPRNFRRCIYMIIFPLFYLFKPCLYIFLSPFPLFNLFSQINKFSVQYLKSL